MHTTRGSIFSHGAITNTNNCHKKPSHTITTLLKSHPLTLTYVGQTTNIVLNNIFLLASPMHILCPTMSIPCLFLTKYKFCALSLSCHPSTPLYNLHQQPFQSIKFTYYNDQFSHTTIQLQTPLLPTLCLLGEGIWVTIHNLSIQETNTQGLGENPGCGLLGHLTSLIRHGKSKALS